MANIEFSVDTSSIGPMLDGKADSIIAALTQRTTAISEALQAKVVGDKLSGQVLNQRTGKLAQSVRVTDTENDGSTITGGVQAGGGPAFYGKYHEDGGTFEVSTRRVALGSRDERLAAMIDMKKLGMEAITHVQSKPYTITFPKRSFMQSSLDESKDKIVALLQEAAKEATE